MKFFILGLFIPSLAMAAGVCSQYNDCEYYTCVAESKKCPRRSYPTSFGRRYCLSFQQRFDAFSPEAQTWIESVRSCLINKMESFREDLSCRELKKEAFLSHVPCYVESGFCELPLKDQKLILKTIWPAMRNVYALANGINVLKKCH